MERIAAAYFGFQDRWTGASDIRVVDKAE
jgi:hypothetical protein